MNLICIMGKSSSGKDTVYNILKEKMDINNYIMYTTRPKRDGEIDGVAYNFISEEEMKDYIAGKQQYKVVESRTYQTIYGPWIYATIDDYQFKSTKDIIMPGVTLECYVKMKEYFEENSHINLLPIYIEVPDNIRLKRAIAREEQQSNPKYTELCRRYIADSKDFSDENLQSAGITKKFKNLDLENCVNDILEYIIQKQKSFDAVDEER